MTHTFLALTLLLLTSALSAQNTMPEEIAADAQTAAQTAEPAKPAENKTLAANKPAYVIADRLGGKFLLQDAHIPYDQRRVVPAQTPDTIKNFKYIIDDGKYYPVKLVGYQVGSEDGDTGRDTWMNFDNRCGWVYQMESGKLLENPKEEWDACWAYPLLVDDAFKKSAKVYPPKSAYKDGKATPLPKDLKEKIEKQYGRQIKNGYFSCTFGDNDEYKFVNIQFKNKGNQALAVVAVVKSDGSIIPLDLPAEWNEESVWRVDDGGEFSGYHLDFATEENGKLYLYLANPGAEGLNLDNYEVCADSLRVGKVGASFYQAPE